MSMDNKVEPTENKSVRNTSQKKRRKLSIRDIIHGFSSALVPLMIGVMTLVFTIQQNKQANENRLKDMEIGKNLREQEIKIDEARRKQDRQLKYERGQQDQLLDIQRRQLDFQLKEGQREHDFKIAQTVRLDSILSTYLNQMSRLLIQYNFTLDNNIRQTIARPKTLIALRQLDPKRKGLIFEYLHESDLIRKHNPIAQLSRLDMSEADFNNIDLMNTHIQRRKLTYLSLVGARIMNAKFDNCILTSSDFAGANMKGTSFKSAVLPQINFFRTSLVNTDFTTADVTFSDFTAANLTGSNITDKQIFSASLFHRTILPNGTIVFQNNFIRNGDAQTCNLDFWSVKINESAEIIYINQSQYNCMFKINANYTNGTISQIIEEPRFSAFIFRGGVYIEVKIDVMKVLLTNTSSFIDLQAILFDFDNRIVLIREKYVDTNGLGFLEAWQIDWLIDIREYVNRTRSTELFINSHSSLSFDNIQLYVEKERIFSN